MYRWHPQTSPRVKRLFTKHLMSRSWPRLLYTGFRLWKQFTGQFLSQRSPPLPHTTDSLSVIQVIIQHPISQRIRDTPITFPFILGTTLAVAGGLTRWWCYRTLGRFFTFQLSVRKWHHIITTGPYAVVRHPSYTAGIIQITDIPGFKLLVVALVVQLTVLVINIVCRVSQEDEALKLAFGVEWERWAKVVRYRLIPGVY